MIKTTVNKLILAESALKRLADLPLPLKQSYQISRVVKAVLKELDVYHQTRIKRAKALGKEVEGDQEDKSKGVQTKIAFDTAENRVKFQTELEEMHQTELTLNVHPFDLTTLPDNVTVSALDLTLMDGLVVYPEETAEPSSAA